MVSVGKKTTTRPNSKKLARILRGGGATGELTTQDKTTWSSCARGGAASQ